MIVGTTGPFFDHLKTVPARPWWTPCSPAFGRRGHHCEDRKNSIWRTRDGKWSRQEPPRPVGAKGCCTIGGDDDEIPWEWNLALLIQFLCAPILDFPSRFRMCPNMDENVRFYRMVLHTMSRKWVRKKMFFSMTRFIYKNRAPQVISSHQLIRYIHHQRLDFTFRNIGTSKAI